MCSERTITVAGEAVRYLDAGAGRPVVLLHAFPLTADMWRPQLDRVPSGFHFIAPDLGGSGGTGTAAAARVEDIAGQVLVLLDALGIDRAVIGGLSMGGYVLFALFRLAPERCSAVILANTRATADAADARAARDAMSALLQARGPSAVARQMLPKLLGATTRAARPDLEDQVCAQMLQRRAEVLEGAIHAMKHRPDSTPLLPQMAVPALVIAGEEDAVIPIAAAEEMQRLLPRAELVTLPRAGHLSNLELPDEFSAALASFLQRPP